MAVRGGNVRVRFTSDTSDLQRGTRTAERDLERMSTRGAASMGKLKTATAGLAIGGLGALGVGLKASAGAAIEAEKSQARLEAQLKALNVSYKAHAKQIDEVIQKTSKLSGLDDEDLSDAFTNIVRVTGNVNQSLRLTGLAADFARAKHMDVAKAGEIVGKVAGGNTGILSRYGIQIDKGASSTEALGLLQQKFAGQAAAYGRTTAGAMDRAKVASENLGEAVGARLNPLLVKAADALVNLVDASGRLAGPIRTSTGAVRNAYESVRGAVDRFAARHREDIDLVISAARALGRAIRTVVEDVVLPVLRIWLSTMQGITGGVAQSLRGLVNVVFGILHGDWKRAWDGFKDIPAGAIRAIRASAGGLARALGSLIKSLVPIALRAAKDIGSALVDGIVNGIKAGAGKVTGAITGLAKKGASAINPFGDGIGQDIAGSAPFPQGGAFGGSLMGARPAMRPFAAAGAGFGLTVSSGLRPGAITSSGNTSWHSTGEAIDMSGSPSGMLGFFKQMRSRFGSRLAELIHTPGGVGIKNGQPFRYTGQVAADHFDHVHVAFDSGKPGIGDGLGRFNSTSYGPPWGGIQGTGVTATGVNLKSNPHIYGVAVDPRVIPLGSNLRITPNPFNYSGTFRAFDTGGAIKGRRIDFYDWRGRRAQLGWGTRSVSVSTATSSASRGGGSSAGSSTSSAGARRSGGAIIGGLKPGRGGSTTAPPWVTGPGMTPRTFPAFPSDTTGGDGGEGGGSDPAVEEQNRLIAEQNELLRQKIAVDEEIKNNQSRILALTTQGKVIEASVGAMVNGWIGERLGPKLGLPSAPGVVAAYGGRL